MNQMNQTLLERAFNTSNPVLFICVGKLLENNWLNLWQKFKLVSFCFALEGGMHVIRIWQVESLILSDLKCC